MQAQTPSPASFGLARTSLLRRGTGTHAPAFRESCSAGFRAALLPAPGRGEPPWQTGGQRRARFPQRLESTAEASGSRIQPDFFIHVFFLIVYLGRGVGGMFFTPTSLRHSEVNKGSRETRVGRRRKRKSPCSYPYPSSSLKKNKSSRQVRSPEGLTFFLCSLSMRPLL